jgi:hypothetical protein
MWIIPGPTRTLCPSGSHRTTRLPPLPFMNPPAAAISTLRRTFRIVFYLKVGSVKLFAARSKTEVQRQGSSVHLSPSCWSPKTLVERVTPSAQGRSIAFFVLSAHPSRNSIQHWWYSRIFLAEVDSKPFPGRLSLLSSYTVVHPTGTQFLGLLCSSS